MLKNVKNSCSLLNQIKVLIDIKKLLYLHNIINFSIMVTRNEIIKPTIIHELNKS